MFIWGVYTMKILHCDELNQAQSEIGHEESLKGANLNLDCDTNSSEQIEEDSVGSKSYKSKILLGVIGISCFIFSVILMALNIRDVGLVTLFAAACLIDIAIVMAPDYKTQHTRTTSKVNESNNKSIK